MLYTSVHRTVNATPRCIPDERCRTDSPDNSLFPRGPQLADATSATCDVRDICLLAVALPQHVVCWCQLNGFGRYGAPVSEGDGYVMSDAALTGTFFASR